MNGLNEIDLSLQFNDEITAFEDESPKDIPLDRLVSVVRGIEVRHLDLPLIKPYALSYKTFESFEPYLVTMTTDDGQVTFGEQHISPGSSSETREGAWSFLTSSAAADDWFGHQHSV